MRQRRVSDVTRTHSGTLAIFNKLERFPPVLMQNSATLAAC